MRLSSLLGHVDEVHAQILKGTASADRVFSEFFRARRYLGAADRRFIAETTYALLRWRDLLGEIARRVPAPWSARAAAGAVALAARGKLPFAAPGLVEGAAEVLRATTRDMEAFGRSAADVACRARDEAARIAFEESFPAWMAERWVARFGPGPARALAAAMNEPAPVTLRANALLTTRDDLARELREAGIETEAGRLSPDALILKKRINVFTVPAFREGKFEVQDEGSQIVSLALDPHPGWRVLDACAGAGGKTLHMAALMKGRGEIFAYEPVERRREELRRRLRRARVQNVRILPPQFPEALAGMMDAVLVDAPCSGTGTIRRNPLIKSRLTPDDIARHHGEQVALLRQWGPCVRPGGLLAYATCSVMAEENEEVVATLPGFSAVAIDRARLNLPPEPAPFLALLPHLHGTDGFFVALLAAAGSSSGR